MEETNDADSEEEALSEEDTAWKEEGCAD